MITHWLRRLLPYTPPAVPAGHAYCHPCRAWRPTDTIPADTTHDIPPFVICTHCGTWLDVEEGATAHA